MGKRKAICHDGFAFGFHQYASIYDVRFPTCWLIGFAQSGGIGGLALSQSHAIQVTTICRAMA